MSTNITNLTPSILEVKCCSNINVSNDLECGQNKSVAQLLEENNEEKTQEEDENSKKD